MSLSLLLPQNASLNRVFMGSMRSNKPRPSLWSIFFGSDEPEPTKYEPPKQKPKLPEKKTPKFKVFISYNHNDFHLMLLIKQTLEKNNIEVCVDIEQLKTGGSISSFIETSLRDNQFVLSIISKDSLLSGWVNKELTATLILDKLGKSRWIPVKVDDSCFDPVFFFKAIEIFDEKINALNINIKKAINLGQTPQAFFDEYDRAVSIKNNFSDTIKSLKSVNVTDISGRFFEMNMPKVVEVIKNVK